MARYPNRKSKHFPPAAEIAGKVRSSKKWDKWEEELILSLRAEGKTYGQISQRLPGRTESACATRASEKLRTQMVLSYNRRWEDREDQLILAGREAGDSFDTISEQLSHRTARSVGRRWSLVLKSRNLSSFAARTTPGYQHRWSVREEQLLRFLRESGQSWTEIAKNISDCTVTQCYSHWDRLLHPPRNERWEEGEERLLVSGYCAGLNWGDIAELIPGRTRRSIGRHWGLYFWLPQEDKPWTSEELTLLAHLRAEGSSWEQISQKIPGHRSNACRTQWYKETEGIQGCSQRNLWSAEEIDTLVALYNTIGPRWEEICKHIPGRTESGCYGQFRKRCTKEDGVGDAPSEYWINYFMSKLHTRTTIQAANFELTH